MTAATKERIEMIKARLDQYPPSQGGHPPLIAGPSAYDDLAWCVDQLLKTVPKPRKRRKAKRIPAGPKVKAQTYKYLGDIRGCFGVPKLNHSGWQRNDAGTCVDAGKWRDNLQAILDRPNPEITPEAATLGKLEYFKGGPAFEPDTHKRAEEILSCLPSDHREGGAV